MSCDCCLLPSPQRERLRNADAIARGLGRGVKSHDYCVWHRPAQQGPFTENEPGLSRANHVSKRSCRWATPAACVCVCVRALQYWQAPTAVTVRACNYNLHGALCMWIQVCGWVCSYGSTAWESLRQQRKWAQACRGMLFKHIIIKSCKSYI